MPSIASETFSLPFSGSVTLSRHCSHQGAVGASERVGRQCLALLTAYRERGPLTDAAAAQMLGVERTTICARRNELKRRGLVQAVDTVKGDYGVNNVRWGFIGVSNDGSAV